MAARVEPRVITRFKKWFAVYQKSVVGMSIEDAVNVFTECHVVTPVSSEHLDDWLKDGRLNGRPQLEILRRVVVYRNDDDEVKAVEVPRTVRTIRHFNNTRPTSVVGDAEKVFVLS